MEDDIEAPEGILKRIGRKLQWAAAILWGLLALLTIAAAEIPLQAPGAPVAFFWSATAIALVLAVALSPPAFFRLPSKGKIVAYLAVLPVFLVQVFAFNGITQIRSSK